MHGIRVSHLKIIFSFLSVTKPQKFAYHMNLSKITLKTNLHLWGSPRIETTKSWSIRSGRLSVINKPRQNRILTIMMIIIIITVMIMMILKILRPFSRETIHFLERKLNKSLFKGEKHFPGFIARPIPLSIYRWKSSF